MNKAPKAYRDFFLDDQPEIQADLRQTVEREISKWLESDEYRALREQNRQRWLKAGIDIDEHTDLIGRDRLMIAKACPELLPVTFREGTWFWDSPPREWFAALFEAACQKAYQSAVSDDATEVSAKRLSDHAGCVPKVIKTALKACSPDVQASGRNGGHKWRYSKAAAELRKVITGKLAGVIWPDSAAELSVPKHSSKIPAKSLRR
jgi:hypothetical protein